ncbi:nonribosomal siderophore peptide synthase SidC [Penicillium manginii]|uniref:nonribosomal siderophore peptide synthase SidC n=1 Tax=Penicillium manginii TaxID=203109 RepID=UPI0025481504|nr:nonribosomal siderophore peptide synthase SidC [Penicillium manginii]KAJ5749508.1 nonribosomal siderophore peptide synthase SidC [Penicillium manginii]
MPTLAGQRWTLQQWLKCGKRFFQAPRAYLIYDDSIDIKKAANCWSELCRAHDVLRTTFVSISDSPLMQVTLDEKFTVAQSLKVVQDNTSTIADLIEKHVREDNKNPSDLKKPPVHLSFLEACDGKAVILRVHHALYDSWNVKMILKDLFSLFAGGSTSQYPPLQRSVQEIISIRQPEAETNYWKQYLSKAQDTIVYSGLGANSNKNTMRPHFKITTDTSSQDISNALSNSISSKSHTSAAIIIAYARALGQLTGRSQPTFGFNHSSRSLESPNGESSIDLTGMSIPTMTVTPLTVDIGTPSRQESFEAVQGHLAQLTRFAQADNLDTLAPKSNSTINIIYPEENGNGHINGTEKTQPLQRYKLDEPLATDYFTNTTPSSIASTVDGLDTSHIHDEQLYFNVLVFPDGKLKVNVSGDEELLRGDKDLVAKLVNNFVTELSGLIQK